MFSLCETAGRRGRGSTVSGMIDVYCVLLGFRSRVPGQHIRFYDLSWLWLVVRWGGEGGESRTVKSNKLLLRNCHQPTKDNI